VDQGKVKAETARVDLILSGSLRTKSVLNLPLGWLNGGLAAGQGRMGGGRANAGQGAKLDGGEERLLLAGVVLPA
jgi:hypothetical protein